LVFFLRRTRARLASHSAAAVDADDDDAIARRGDPSRTRKILRSNSTNHDHDQDPSPRFAPTARAIDVAIDRSRVSSIATSIERRRAIDGV